MLLFWLKKTSQNARVWQKLPKAHSCQQTVSENVLYMSHHVHPPSFSQGGCDSISHVAHQLHGAVSCRILHLLSYPIIMDDPSLGTDYLSPHIPAPAHRTTDPIWCKVAGVLKERGVFSRLRSIGTAPEGN